MKKYFVLLFCICSLNVSAQVHTTKGTEFWFTFMENLDLAFNGPPAFSVIVSSESNTTGQIEFPATGLTIPFTVTAMQATEVFLPPGILYPQGDENIFNYGIKVTANDSVNVFTYHHRVYFTEATLVVPESELTSHYMITAQSDFNVTSPSELVVEALNDSTLIEIIPSVITVGFRPANVPFYVTLNKAQVFQLQSYYNLSGTTITSVDSTKKLAVFSGARQADVYCTGADDHLYDMDYMAMFGKAFVTVPLLNQGGDPFIILSLEDSNNVRINNGIPIPVLTKGTYIDTVLTTASYIVSEKPISVAQYNKSQSCNASNQGDASMHIIPPVNLLKYRSIFQCNDGPVQSLMPNHFVNIVVPTGAGVPVSLDGLPVSGFQPVSANPQFSYKQVSITNGSHNLYSPSGFNAYAYGRGDYNAYAFHLGFDFLNTPTSLNETEVSFNATISPNPFSESAILQLAGSKTFSSGTLQIFSVDGKLVSTKSFNGNSVTIQRNKLDAGIYFYIVKSGGEIIAKGKMALQ